MTEPQRRYRITQHRLVAGQSDSPVRELPAREASVLDFVSLGKETSNNDLADRLAHLVVLFWPSLNDLFEMLSEHFSESSCEELLATGVSRAYASGLQAGLSGSIEWALFDYGSSDRQLRGARILVKAMRQVASTEPEFTALTKFLSHKFDCVPQQSTFEQESFFLELKGYPQKTLTYILPFVNRNGLSKYVQWCLERWHNELVDVLLIGAIENVVEFFSLLPLSSRIRLAEHLERDSLTAAKYHLLARALLSQIGHLGKYLHMQNRRAKGWFVDYAILGQTVRISAAEAAEITLFILLDNPPKDAKNLILKYLLTEGLPAFQHLYSRVKRLLEVTWQTPPTDNTIEVIENSIELIVSSEKRLHTIRNSASDWQSAKTLLTFILNAARDYLVQQKKRSFVQCQQSIENAIEHIEPYEILMNEELIIDLQLALRSLSPIEQEILKMHHFQGMTCKQIAHELGMAKSTVWRRLKHATNTLRHSSQLSKYSD